MNREKRIEEMAKIIQNGEIDRNRGDLCCDEFTTDLVIKVGLQRLAGAKALYNAGYRLASDLEAEIADLKAIAEQYQKQFEEARTDVTREIIADLENGIDKYLKVYVEEREKEWEKDTPLAEYYSGKIDSYVSIKIRLAELKKKYEVKGNDV